jgi:predicted aspartyl protease
VLLPRLAALALWAVPSLAFGGCPAPVAELPLSEQHGKLLLPVAIQGSPELVALDTGAGITVVSTEAAGRLNILHDFDNSIGVGGVGGANSILYIGKLDHFDLGPLHLAPQRFPIVDMPMRTNAGVPVSGLLGADILHAFDAEIDIAGGRLTLWRAGACGGAGPDWADTVNPVSIDLDDNNHVLLPVRVGEANLQGILDTGASDFVLTERAALRAGLTEDGLQDDPVINGTGVNNRAYHGHYHRFDKVQFAGVAFPNVPTAIVPSASISSYNALIGADALVGVSLLRHTRLFISYRNRALYLRPLQSRPAE